MRGISGYLLAGFLAVGLLSGCASADGLKIRHVPEIGFEHTLHYRFQAEVHVDAEGNCRKLSVRVEPQSEFTSLTAPPARLRLFDDNCLSPVRFERISYISRSGGQVRLAGSDVHRFWSDHFRLQDELVGWLWREGII